VKNFCVVVLLLIGTTVFAHRQPCPGGWAIEGSYIYLLPSVDDTYFVISGPEASLGVAGTRINNDFGFNSGFRVGGAYAFCTCDRQVQGYYTRLRAQQSKTISGDHLWATGVGAFFSIPSDFAGVASSNNTLLYQRVDGFLDQKLLCCCGVNVSVLAGMEYSYFKFHQEVDYTVTNTAQFAAANNVTKTWGVGPQLGVCGDYDICKLEGSCPGVLSFNIFTSGSFLASKTSTRIGQTASFVDINDEASWRLITAFHTRLGFNYATRFSCFGVSLEAGYEFNTYLRNATKLIVGDEDVFSATGINYYDFDVQGLYLSAAFIF